MSDLLDNVNRFLPATGRAGDGVLECDGGHTTTSGWGSARQRIRVESNCLPF